MTEDQTLDILIGDLVEPMSLLRLISSESVEYLELRDSIRDNGFLNTICVRPLNGKYEIIDGFTRYRCAVDLRLSSIPCLVKHGATDAKVLSWQLSANAIRPETMPAEFALQMKRMMTLQPEMTFTDMARLINKSPTWVRERLSLTKLPKATMLMVDRGEMPLASAFMLAKVPVHYQLDFVDRARTMPAAEFKDVIAAFIKQYTEGIRQGKLDDLFVKPYVAHAYLLPVKEVEAELLDPQVGALLVVADNCKTPLDGFYSALRWACQLDRQTVAAREEHARKLRKESD